MRSDEFTTQTGRDRNGRRDIMLVFPFVAVYQVHSSDVRRWFRFFRHRRSWAGVTRGLEQRFSRYMRRLTIPIGPESRRHCTIRRKIDALHKLHMRH